MGSEVEVLRAPSYQIQQTRMPNHPGQIKVSVYDRVQEELVEFQLLADLVSDGRFYCNFSAGDMTPLRVPIPLPPSPLLSLGALGIVSLYSGCQLACDGLLRVLCQLVL